MSNTPKDDPYWVKSNDPSRRGDAYHRCRDHGISWRLNDRECDIDVPLNATETSRNCQYYVADHVKSRYRYTRGPTKVERHVVYWGPNRRQVRDSIDEMKRQHYAGVELDDSEVEVDDHRHSPFAGYWD